MFNGEELKEFGSEEEAWESGAHGKDGKSRVVNRKVVATPNGVRHDWEELGGGRASLHDVNNECADNSYKEETAPPRTIEKSGYSWSAKEERVAELSAYIGAEVVTAIAGIGMLLAPEPITSIAGGAMAAGAVIALFAHLDEWSSLLTGNPALLTPEQRDTYLLVGRLLEVAGAALGLIGSAGKNALGSIKNRKGQFDDLFKAGKDDVVESASIKSPTHVPEMGGFKHGMTSEEIMGIAKEKGACTTITGEPSSALAAAYRYEGFWKKAAAIVREIAGRHMFNDANKRTAQAVIEELMKRNKITTGVDSAEMGKVIKRVASGDLKEIDDIATAMRGF